MVTKMDSLERARALTAVAVICVSACFACGDADDSSIVDAGGDTVDADTTADAAAYASVDLTARMTPVKSQGSRNTCSVFAATAVIEYLVAEESGEEYDLSEQYNYWAAKEHTLTNDVLLAYESMDALAGYLALSAYTHSSMLESEWPYENQNWQQSGNEGCYEVEGVPISECFTGVPPQGAELAPWTVELIYVDRQDIGSYIVEHEVPVLINVTWYPDAVDATGTFHMPTSAEMDGAGGHVIVLVGYDPEAKQFIFRNSWGVGWGDGGYGTMPEDYILQHYEAAQWEPIDQYDDDTFDMLSRSANGTTAVLL